MFFQATNAAMSIERIVFISGHASAPRAKAAHLAFDRNRTSQKHQKPAGLFRHDYAEVFLFDHMRVGPYCTRYGSSSIRLREYIQMPNLKKFAIAIMLLFAGFLAGTTYEAWRYNDLCLDMGGGRNPGNHAICVLEIERTGFLKN